MNTIKSATDHFARTKATTTFISPSYENAEPALSPIDCYNILETLDQDKFDNHDLSPWLPFEGCELKDLFEEVTTEERSLKMYLENFADCIKEGMIIIAINDSLSLDINDIDIDTLATIGFNTQQTVSFNGEELTFDKLSGQWKNTQGNLCFDFNLENGLPKTE